MTKIKLKKGILSIPNSDDIIAKYITLYEYVLKHYEIQYSNLPKDTILSDFLYCFFLTCKQYHPLDKMFKDVFIIKFEAQLKLSEQEDIKWR